ncbi:hypothetical protein HZC31_02855 [Candidatus Woesearchaeota archaeon]|nr:hypothetical protein [Candidatus Woesearchaeota archaeon]
MPEYSMKESQNPLIIPAALLLTALPYAAAFYHNEQLCKEDPAVCAVYEQKYNIEQHNFDLTGALEHGMTKLEELIHTYTQ